MRRERRHGHQTDKIQTSCATGEGNPLGKIADWYASFCRIIGDIHLDEDLDAAAALGTRPAQTDDVICVAQAVDGNAERNELSELPSLNAADEMKARAGWRSSVHGFQVIDPVFTEIHRASSDQWREHVRRLFLGHRDESDPLRITSVLATRRRDQGTYLGKIGRDALSDRRHGAGVPSGNARSRTTPRTVDAAFARLIAPRLPRP